MKCIIRLFYLLLIVSGFQCKSERTDSLYSNGKADKADAVYTNGKIYTVNKIQKWAEAFAIKNGKFIKVGTTEDVKVLIGDSTEVVDLKGQFVMPGIIDAHIHPFEVYRYQESGNLQFSNQLKENEIADEITKFAEENPDKEWIVGGNYGFGVFPNGKMTKEWLDNIVPDRPAYMIDESGHNATANSLALKIAGITKETPNPPLGAIDKDPITGEPTGYLSETGMGLIGKHLGIVDADAYYRMLSQSLPRMSAWGITSYIDVMMNKEALEGYLKLDKEGKLPFQINAALSMNEYTNEIITAENAKEYLPEFVSQSTDKIRTNNFKYWGDGTPLSYTSLLLEKYADKDTHGSVTMTDDMREDAINFLGKGYYGHIHSVADGSTDYMLNLVEEAEKRFPGKVKRFHLAHSMLVAEKDYKRISEMGVAVEIGPAFWYPSPVQELVTKKLGKERAERWFDIRGMLDAGINLAWGSDWPAGTPDANALRGLEAMITRAHPWGEYEGTWGTPISLDEGLQIITMGSAYAMNRENEMGSIEEGKYANFIILDRNLFEIAPSSISDILVEKTIFNGDVVFNRDKAEKKVNVTEFEITNEALKNAVGSASLNILIQEEVQHNHKCFGTHNHETEAGSKLAPEEVNKAFEVVVANGYECMRPARTVYWKPSDAYYWIQWMLKNNVISLWAYDPEAGEAVEVLEIKN